MMIFPRLMACLALGLMLAPPAAAQASRDDQANARAEMAAGRNMPARNIERMIVPRYERQGFEYLTFEYDGTAVIYRFKFIKEGRLLFVDADPRTGRVLREQR
jgi:hypothetical protein